MLALDIRTNTGVTQSLARLIMRSLSRMASIGIKCTAIWQKIYPWLLANRVSWLSIHCSMSSDTTSWSLRWKPQVAHQALARRSDWLRKQIPKNGWSEQLKVFLRTKVNGDDTDPLSALVAPDGMRTISPKDSKRPNWSENRKSSQKITKPELNGKYYGFNWGIKSRRYSVGSTTSIL
jgi:hypothetical protein